MLKLKLQYFGHLTWRTDSFDKILILGKIEGGRRRGQQRMRRLDDITETQWVWVWMNSGSWWWTGRSGVLWFMGSQRVEHDRVTELNKLQHPWLLCPSPSPWVFSIHVHWIGDPIQPSHPLPSPSPPAFNLSQHQGLFQWVGSSHQVAKVLELQLEHQPFQWIFRVDFL